jgi:hypothetical protein
MMADCLSNFFITEGDSAPSLGNKLKRLHARFSGILKLAPTVLLLLLSATTNSQTVSGTTDNGLSYSASNTQISITGWLGVFNHVTVPDSINGMPVTAINKYAFSCDPFLASIIIPASVTSIGDEAFNGDFNLLTVIFKGNAPATGAGIFAYTSSDLTVNYYAGAIGFTSPSWTDSYGTTHASAQINDVPLITSTLNAPAANGLPFSYQITAINSPTSYLANELPDGLSVDGVSGIISGTLTSTESTIVGICASNPLGTGSAALTIVIPPPFNYTVSNGVSVTITGYTGTSGTAKIPSFINVSGTNLPVTNIGDWAFSGSPLAGITIPGSVTAIGKNAFSGCSNLTNITIPDSVTSIGWWAFLNCTKLNSVTLSKNLTGIAFEVFSGCTCLSRVTIPEGVKSIENDAFDGCTSLTDITIPASVTSIGSGAFFGCTNLKMVVFMGNAPAMMSSKYSTVFDSKANSLTVYYLNGASGFTSPTWILSPGEKHKAVNLGSKPIPTPVSAGSYYNAFNGDVPIWDITGEYSGTVGHNIGLDLFIVEDSTGKLSGHGALYSGDGDWYVKDGYNLTVSGAVRNSGTNTIVTMTMLGSGSGSVGVIISPGYFLLGDMTFTHTIKLNAEVSGTTLFITGGSSSARLKYVQSGRIINKFNKIDSGAALALPADVTGDWDLTLNLKPKSNLFTGTVTVQTSTGALSNLTATASYSVKSNTSAVALKGAGGSNLNMVISTSGTAMTIESVKGKLYGQSLMR